MGHSKYFVVYQIDPFSEFVFHINTNYSGRKHVQSESVALKLRKQKCRIRDQSVKTPARLIYSLLKPVFMKSRMFSNPFLTKKNQKSLNIKVLQLILLVSKFKSSNVNFMIRAQISSLRISFFFLQLSAIIF